MQFHLFQLSTKASVAVACPSSVIHKVGVDGPPAWQTGLIGASSACFLTQRNELLSCSHSDGKGVCRDKPSAMTLSVPLTRNVLMYRYFLLSSIIMHRTHLFSIMDPADLDNSNSVHC